MPFVRTSKTKLVLAITESGLTAGEFRVGKENLGQLNAFSEQSLDPGVIEAGRLLKPNRFKEALEELMYQPKFGQFTSSKATVLLPQELFTHHVARVSAPQVHGRLASLKEKVLHAMHRGPLDDLYLHASEHIDGDTCYFSFSDCSRKDVSRYDDIMSGIGLEKSQLLSWPAAAMAYFFSDNTPAEPVLWLHAGRTYSYLALADMHGVYKSLSVATNLSQVLGSLKRRFLLSEKGARLLAFEHGLRQTNPEVVHGAIPVLRQYVRRLSDEAKALQAYYAYVHRQEDSLALLLSGEGSYIPGLAEEIESMLGISSRVHRPAFRYSSSSDPIFIQEAIPLCGAVMATRTFLQ